MQITGVRDKMINVAVIRRFTSAFLSGNAQKNACW
jgi:hypothetical protein